MKVNTIEIGGRLWPIVFSLYCIDSNPALAAAVDEQNFENLKFKTQLDLIYSLIVSGCEFCNTWKVRPEGVEFDKKGRIEPMPRKAFMLAIQPGNMGELMKAVQETMEKDHVSKINAVPSRDRDPSKKKKRNH